MVVDFLSGILRVEVRLQITLVRCAFVDFTPELQSTIQFEPGFTAIMLHHPATYVNKVLVASSQGSMQLWNIRTQ